MTKPRISPKLVVDDADAAVEFYSAVLGAAPGQRFAHDGSVVFASMHVDGQEIQLKDADSTDRPPPVGGGGVVLDVTSDAPDEVVARAVEQGAEVVFPVSDQPYGARQGRFRDPFGHQWIVGTPLSLTDEEVQAALDDL